jgi:hypothetical protein
MALAGLFALGIVSLELRAARTARAVRGSAEAGAVAARALDETLSTSFDLLPALHGNSARIGAVRVRYSVSIAGADLLQLSVEATPDDPEAQPVRLTMLRARP